MRKIAILGTTNKIARRQLEWILSRMRCEDIDVVNNSVNGLSFSLRNGDMYKAFAANDNLRGYRFDFAYVDRNIYIETLTTIILPILTYQESENVEFY